METSGVAHMARTNAKPRPTKAEPSRTTIINLKGSTDQAEWLESVHRKTHLSKTVIVRLALRLWAEQNQHAPFPMTDEED